MHQDKDKVVNHYQDDYFNKYQRDLGEFGGRANAFMFDQYITPADEVVLDFGCGGGFLLKNLHCSRKVGIEINPVARDFCIQANGITCYESLEYIPDESIDVVISSHCLEHTTNPFEIISALYDKLKNKGKIVIVVPLDSYRYAWVPRDINNHLYSFSPMNLGNILQGAGFKQVKTEAILHKWVPGYKTIERVFGLNIFHHLSFLYGTVFNKRSVQVRGYGLKDNEAL